MSEKILNFEISSPEELKEKLSVPFERAQTDLYFVNLVVSGSQVLARLFQFEAVPSKEIKNRLLHDAVELLSLPASEIELTYQTLIFNHGKVSGIYAYLPKKLLQEYIAVIDQARCIPLNITISSVRYLNNFFQEAGEGRECFLSFSNPNIVYLTVFSNKQCELFREIPYESMMEAENEILQSLRSVCAKSSVKQFERVRVMGKNHMPAELIKRIEDNFKTVVEEKPDSAAEGISDGKITLNLAKNYAFSIRERKNIVKILNLAVVVFAVIAVLSGINIMISSQKIANVKKSYTPTEHQHAFDLKRAIKKLKNHDQ